MSNGPVELARQVPVDVGRGEIGRAGPEGSAASGPSPFPSGPWQATQFCANARAPTATECAV